MAVAEAKLVSGSPPRSAPVDDERAFEDPGPVSSIGAGIHADAPADRPWDRAGELEAPEACVARPMQADGVRSAATRDETVTVHFGPGQLASELQDESLEPGVGDEEVGTEPHRRDGQASLARKAERLLQLGHSLGLRKGSR